MSFASRIFLLCLTMFFCSSAYAQIEEGGRKLHFYQPSAETLSKMEPGVIFLNDIDEGRVEDAAGYILVDNVPYYRYWQLERDDAYAFHPSALASVFNKYLRHNHDKLDDVFLASQELAVELPNGGITWYYPEVYPLNRMIGPKLQYSALSQARLLTVAMRMAKEDYEKYGTFLEQVRKALEFDYAQGGVLWNGRVLLEIPLYYGPPEIVLNGWLDALLQYGDYVQAYGDENSKRIFRDNLAELARLLPHFDSPAHKLSLYSNVSPLRVTITGERPDQQYEAVFKSSDKAYSNYSISLGRLPKPVIAGRGRSSPFDVQILSQSGNKTTAYLSCNSLFTTTLKSDAPFDMRFSTGTFDNKRSSPAAGGEVLEFSSKRVGNQYEIAFNRSEKGIFCGYPTNFAKRGEKNYYHQFHVVALAYLAMHPMATVEQQQEMRSYASLWMGYTEDLEAEGLNFSSFQHVLNSINARKRDTPYQSWESLRQTIGAE